MNTITVPEPMNRNIYFCAQVNQQNVEAVTRKIIDINENDAFLKKYYSVYDLEYTPKPIKIFIDSYGGAVYQILGLVSIIEKSEVPVHTICTGSAFSCGFILLISGHKRFAYSNSTMMLHQVSSGTVDKAKTMEEDLTEVKRLQNKLEDIIVAKTKIKKTNLDKIYKMKYDWFLNSTEAKKLNVIDEII